MLSSSSCTQLLKASTHHTLYNQPRVWFNFTTPIFLARHHQFVRTFSPSWYSNLPAIIGVIVTSKHLRFGYLYSGRYHTSCGVIEFKLVVVASYKSVTTILQVSKYNAARQLRSGTSYVIPFKFKIGSRRQTMNTLRSWVGLFQTSSYQPN